MYFLLFYDYIENVVDKRTPYREAHLALVNEYLEQGEIQLAGAFADPVDGAVLVFKTENKEHIEEFVRQAPYVQNGLVTKWRIREWRVVTGK